MVAISAQMNANLAALLGASDEFAVTQNRLATGKVVNTAMDNPAVYFRALGYTAKADALTSVNAQMSLGTKNLETVNNALDSIYKSLDGTLSTLKDARSKATVAAAKVATTGGTAYTNTAATGAAPNAQIVVPTSSTGDARKLNDAGMFQSGDTFAVTVTDSTTGFTNTRWFRAIDSAKVVSGIDLSKALSKDVTHVSATNTSATSATAAAANGTSEIQAYNFTDLASLKDKLNDAFGSAFMVVDTVTNGTNVSLNLTGANERTNISFTQVFNNDPSLTGTAVPAGGTLPSNGTTFDFGKLFGGTTVLGSRSGLTGQNTAAVTGTATQANRNSAWAAGQTFAGEFFNTYTYSPTNGTGTSLASSLETRRQAADTFRQALYNAANMIADAANPGFANILRGETFSVDLNETGEVKQTLKLDALNLTSSFGYSVNADTGAVTTATTGTNFDNDNAITSAINSLTQFLQTVRIRQNAVASASAMLNSRLDYNKAQIKVMENGANEMTAANTAVETTKAAALQNQVNFATNNMALTKQMEASLIQLMR